MQSLSPEEVALNHTILHQPSRFLNRYTEDADFYLRQVLFRSLACQRDDYLQLFFPNGPPTTRLWKLRDAQGATDGAEYSAAAKGTACGHIFKSGESTYQCKTCAADDTCVLCARCFEASDHEGHTVYITISPGNSGCCDCGDREAWRREVNCTIHCADIDEQMPDKRSGKARVSDGHGKNLPADLVEAIRMTIARVADYLCDVFSCSPEQLRLPKTELTIKDDERLSRLSLTYGDEPIEEEPEYALILWNDEKHTVFEVENQVARACSQAKSFGLEKAMEVNDIGRSIVHYSTDINELLHMAAIIEHLKLTVTIRSARDTFREQMCATMIDWIADIAGCSVGDDAYILRNIICEELLRPWRTGSHAGNREIAQEGIDDHEIEDNERWRRQYRSYFNTPTLDGAIPGLADLDDEEDDEEINEDGQDYDIDMDDDDMGFDIGEIQVAARIAMNTRMTDADMDLDHLDADEDGAAEVMEATIAGYPPPPPPPPAPGHARRAATPADSEDGEAEHSYTSVVRAPYETIPKTPKARPSAKRPPRPSKHWLDKPEGFRTHRSVDPCEDLWQRVRLDFLILYDLRLWKVLRISLRHLYITTVVTIPHFKRILGLRFAGLYTTLAQLYLIADREPDHSIINLSVQMLTTPSITNEVVERGNFLANLTAILYTFITTRQVGFPEDVSPRATLAFDAGAVANRRIFHFFMDLRCLYHSDFILYRMRTEPRYLLQFLDLIKLLQGVCPNVRATGEHVEYESDIWISATPMIKEVNKLCKQVAISFEPKAELSDSDIHLQRALRTTAQVTMINSFGYERKRFHAAELKDDLAWHTIGPFGPLTKAFSVPKHVVQSEPMSFHHPLHYFLSWLIENAKEMSRESLRMLLQFAPQDLKDPWTHVRGQPAPGDLTSDELLSSIFEHPLRVCVWLAQMKAAMWVRNGITLRHQAHNYRSVQHRDVAYQRDIFMIQCGFVLCGSDADLPGERFLAQMIDRFQMTEWFGGGMSIVPGFEENQQIDVIEDFLHLLVISLTERGSLVSAADPARQPNANLQREIAHTLCFKPLSFSDLVARITEKISESEDFDRILESMTVYRAPEGLSDTGTFELKAEYVETIDPYYAYYTRNHREDAEQILKKHIAKKTGQAPEDVVCEPNLAKISTGLFKDLAAFTRTPLFVQVIAVSLQFVSRARQFAAKTQATRIETFLHMVLRLMMIATLEDLSHPNGGQFIKLAIQQQRPTNSEDVTVVTSLIFLSQREGFDSCRSTMNYILRKMHSKYPEPMSSWCRGTGILQDSQQADSPASMAMEEKERKKQEALARQARIMAKMKEQQNHFLLNQGLWEADDEYDDLDDIKLTGDTVGMDHKKTWSFPSGTCIWCQEETDDQKLYGTFAFLGESQILRSTPFDDRDYVQEAINSPVSLDRSADQLRPYGVSGQNIQVVQKIGADGNLFDYERKGLSKGFPHQHDMIKAPVATSCGHIMHYSCLLLYLAHSARRHTHQIARNHPENIERREFVCPLCKALGNTFLPIIWPTKDCTPEHKLHAAPTFEQWITEADDSCTANLSFMGSKPEAISREQRLIESHASRCAQYVSQACAPPLSSSLGDLSLGSPPHTAAQPPARASPNRRYSFTRLLWGRGRSEDGQSATDTSSLPSQSEPISRSTELDRAYVRIEETISSNKLDVAERKRKINTSTIGTLSRALGLSISTFEISQRGVNSDPKARSLLPSLSEQNITHFRILSETIDSYLSVKTLRPTTRSVTGRDIVKKQEFMRAQLFGVMDSEAEVRLQEVIGSTFLQDDIFLFFVDWLSFFYPSIADAINVLQLCYWAEIFKSIVAYTDLFRHENGAMLEMLDRFVPQIAASAPFINALRAIAGTDTFQDIDSDTIISGIDPPFWVVQQAVQKQALTFLRKSTIAIYIRYGLDFECPYEFNPESPEIERLTALLHIPTMDEMCQKYMEQSVAGLKLQTITHRWLIGVRTASTLRPDLDSILTLSHPAIFELVGLPRTYDALTEEAIRRKCPTTGKEVTDPAVCLLCGAIFCSQSVCCSSSKTRTRGGCQQHMEQHGMRVGLFLNVRKCMVLLLHGQDHGSWAFAPYLDRHGEPDPTLRRRHQLFLDARRYDRLLRDIWLQHQIPTVVARKLEADINPGGWDTL